MALLRRAESNAWSSINIGLLRRPWPISAGGKMSKLEGPPTGNLSGKYHRAHSGEQFGVRRLVAAFSNLLQDLSKKRAAQLQYSSTYLKAATSRRTPNCFLE